MECNSITVIVPVYLVEQYLDECIKSLVDQTVPFYEILLIVDGSPDGCLTICRSYVEEYTNIRVINKENEGPSATRNLGILQAQSEYVVFVDGDDYIEPWYVETLQSCLKKERLDILCFDAKEVNEISGAVFKRTYDRGRVLSRDVFSGYDYIKQCFPKHYVVSPCISAYKKSMLAENRVFFPEGLFYEDSAFTFSAMHAAKSVRYMPDQLYIRRYRENSTMTSVMDEKKFSDMTEINLLIWKHMLDFYSKDHSRKFFYRLFVCQCIISALYRMNFENALQLDLTKYKIRLLEAFWKTMAELGILQDDLLLSWSENNAVLIALNEINQMKRSKPPILQIILTYFSGEESYGNWEKERMKQREKQLCDKLLRLPFDEKEKKFVIYGLGKHTKRLLELYEAKVGPIHCQLEYAVTQLQQEQVYNGKRVFSIWELPSDTDGVVISSFYYEDEMLEQLEQYYNGSVPRISIYDKNDICDIMDLELQRSFK